MTYFKTKYRFNCDSLKFEELTKSPRQKLGRWLNYFLFTSITALVSIVFISTFIGTPKEIILSRFHQKYTNDLVALNYKLDSINNFLIKSLYKNDNTYRTILKLDTIPLTIREAGIGGSETDIELQNPLIIMQLISKFDKIERQLKIQDDSYKKLMVSAYKLNQKVSRIPSIMPVSKKDLTLISSYFGRRVDPFYKRIAIHHGLDYVSAVGTKVYATGDGTVTLSNYSRKGYGNEVVIDHFFGFKTRYAHLSKIIVKDGQKVKRGQIIGLVGSTGRSTGSHLHYEVRYQNKPVNPMFYYSDEISVDEYQKMVGKVNSQKSRSN